MAKKKHPGAGRQKEQARRAAEAVQSAAVALPESLALALGSSVFTTDVALPHLLHAVAARVPLPRARVRSLDVAAARSARGVRTVKVLRAAGTETSSFGEAWALVVAESRTAAEDARGLLKVDLEALPPPETGSGAPPADDAFGPVRGEGAPDEVFQGAAFRLAGRYGWERQTLAEWEPHAIVCEPVADGLHVWAASEDPAGLAAGLAVALSLPPAKVRVVASHVGAIFGGRTGTGALDVECARLALELKAPVRLVYDRTSELYVGGHREPGYAEIELGADKDFHVTAWRSRSWPAGDPPAEIPVPHLFVPAHRAVRSALAPRAAGDAAEGSKSGAPAPSSRPSALALQLAAAFSGCAFDDLAALTGQSPLDLLLLNLTLAEPYGDRLHALLKETDRFVKWTTRWHPRGDASEGPVRRGLGLGFALWMPEPGATAAPPPPPPPAPVETPPQQELVGPPVPSVSTEFTPDATVADPANPAASAAPAPPPEAPAPGPAKDAAPGILAIVTVAAAVDRQTGIVTVEKVSVVSERPSGTPAPVQRLIEAALARGATQGVSPTLFEEGDAGRIAAACELGESAVQLIEGGLGGAGGSVEGWELAARWAAPAAAANAVTNAVALRLPTLPLTPERLLAALAPPPPPAPPAPPPSASPAPAVPGTTPPPANGTSPATSPPPAATAPTVPTAPPAPTPPASAETPPPGATTPPPSPDPVPPPGRRR